MKCINAHVKVEINMKKGNNYTYQQIEDFVNEKEYEITSFNAFESDVIGEAFVVIRKESNDITISFMLVGNGKFGFTYECIYSDLP